MSDVATLTIRPVDEQDLSAIEALDEKISGSYRPDHWERQITYYLMRDAESALVATEGDQLVGFMFGDIRGWEFGLTEPTGWIEVIGVDPDHRKKKIGRQLADALFAHWKTMKVETARTLVDASQEGIAGFMSSLGLEPSQITAYQKTL